MCKKDRESALMGEILLYSLRENIKNNTDELELPKSTPEYNPEVVSHNIFHYRQQFDTMHNDQVILLYTYAILIDFTIHFLLFS